MDFLGKDKLARLDEEKQQRRKARAEEAQKRLEEVGKQTQQMVAETVSPNKPANVASPDGSRPGGLSRVLFEQATSSNDGRRASRGKKRALDLLGVQAEGRRALTSIDKAMSTIQSAMVDATGAGLHGGLEGAARSVTEAVDRVSAVANGGVTTHAAANNPLADIMQQEAEETAASHKEATQPEHRETHHHGFGHLAATALGGSDAALNLTAGFAGGHLGLELGHEASHVVQQGRNAAVGMVAETASNLGQGLGGRLTNLEAAITSPRDAATGALREAAGALASPRDPASIASNLIENPRETIADAVNAPREAVARAAAAPREIADSLRDAPAHVVDNVQQIARHAMQLGEVSSDRTPQAETASGAAQKGGTAETAAAGATQTASNTAAGAAQKGSTAETAAAGAAQAASNTAAGAAQKGGTAENAAAGAAQNANQNAANAAGAAGQNAASAAAGGATHSTGTQNAGAHATGPNAGGASAHANAPAHGNAHAAHPANHAAHGAAAHGGAAHAHTTPTQHPAHSGTAGVQHPTAPHSSAAIPAHGNPTGAAPAPRPPTPGPSTPAHATTPASERQVKPAAIQPSRDRANVDVGADGQSTITPQPVRDGAPPALDRKQNPLTQPSFNIEMKAESAPIPAAPEAPAPPTINQPPITQAAPPATTTTPTTSTRSVTPLAPAPPAVLPTANAELAAGRAAAQNVTLPKGTTTPLPPSTATMAPGASPAPAGPAHPGVSAVKTNAAAAPAPTAAPIRAQALPATPTPAAPSTPAATPAPPTVPEVKQATSTSSVPDPASLVTPTVSLSSDRSATSSAISAEAQTQSKVAPEAAAARQAQINPLGPQMTTTGHSADAPITGASSNAATQSTQAAASGRAREAAEAASARQQIQTQATGGQAERAQFAAMPPPPILAQTSAAAMQPAVAGIQAAVEATAHAVAQSPAVLDPNAIARGHAAAATSATLPPFDAERFNQIDQHPPPPALNTANVDTAHQNAAQTYAQATAAVDNLGNIPPPIVNAPGGDTGEKTSGGYPTREAAIAKIEQQVAQQSNAQAPAQMKSGAAVVQGQLNTHITTNKSQTEAQTATGVSSAQSQAAEIAARPPPITGAQAAAQAQPAYQAHQTAATTAHQQMQTQIAGAQASAQGSVATAKGERQAAVQGAQNTYHQTVQGQVMPQYTTAQQTANQQFTNQNQTAQQALGNEQAQAQAQATTQAEQAKTKAETDITAHQAQLDQQRQAAVTNHQQQVTSATAAHEAQMRQQQAQMDQQVQQHQSEMHSQVSAQQAQGQQEINRHLTDGETGYRQQIQQGEQQAAAEKAKADAAAQQKKEEADAEKKKHSGGLFGGIIGWVKDKVDGLLNAVKDLISDACKLIVGIMEKARQAAMAVMEKARQAALAAMEKVKGAIQGIISACANAIKSVIAECANAIRGLITALSNILQGIVQALTSMLSALVSAFQAAMNAVLDGLIAAVSLVNKDLGDKLRNATQKYRDAFNTAMNGLKSNIEAAGKVLEAGIQRAADGAIAVVDAAQQTLDAAVDTAAKVLNKAVDVAFEVAEAEVNAAFDAAEWGVNQAFNVAEATVTAYAAVLTAAVDVVQAGVDAYADFAISVADKVMEAVDKIAQAVVSLIPDSWKKAFVDFWNGPWRSVIIIGLATIAAVAITVATLGTGAPVAAVLMAAVIGGTIAGTTYFGGELVARESDIALSTEGKGMYIPGYGDVQIGPDGKPIPPPNLTPEQQAEFDKKAGWAMSNFNLQHDQNGQVTGYDRKGGSEITNYAAQEGMKGFAEGAISSGLAVAGGALGGAAVKGLGLAAESTMGSLVSAGVSNIVTGPVQNALTGAFDAGFDAIRDGKNPVDALKAAWGAGSHAMTDPGAWAAAIVTMGVAPIKLKFIAPALESRLGQKLESEAAKTVVSKGTDVVVDSMAGTVGSVGGAFVTAYADAIAKGKTPAEAIAAGRKAADEAFTPEAIATTVMLSTAGAIAAPKAAHTEPNTEATHVTEHAPTEAHPTEPTGAHPQETTHAPEHPTESTPPSTRTSSEPHEPLSEPNAANAKVSTEAPPGPKTEPNAATQKTSAEPKPAEHPQAATETSPRATEERPTGQTHEPSASEKQLAKDKTKPDATEATTPSEHPQAATVPESDKNTPPAGVLHEPPSPKQISEHEPRLAAIARNADGAPPAAVAAVRESRAEIAKLKSQRTRIENGTGKWEHATPAEREAQIKLLDDKIHQTAQAAVDKYDRSVGQPTSDAATLKTIESRTPEEIAARKKEVAEARTETTARDKALVQEVHANTVTEGGAQHVNQVYDHITLGAGFAGTANEMSRPGAKAGDIVIGGANPWDGAKSKFGQPAGHSELPNHQPGHGMTETASDPSKRYMLASKHADNVALNKNDAGLRSYDGRAGSIEPGPQADWPKFAKEGGATARMAVTGPDGEIRYFYTKGADVASGPGPNRRLPESVLDSATLKRMQDAGVFAFGDQGFHEGSVKSGEIANIGAGAAGAWGSEAAANKLDEHGARVNDVEWIGNKPAESGQNTPAQREKLRVINDELAAAKKSGDPQAIKTAIDKLTTFTFEEAARNGNLPRNREKGAAFDKHMQKGAVDPESGMVGNISRTVVEETRKITFEPETPGGPDRVRIEVVGADGKPKVIWKDALVLSIGQDAKGKGGPVELVKHYEGKLVPIYGPEGADGFKPVVGVQSPDGSVRILGAAATMPDVSRMLDPSVMTHEQHQDNLRKQAEGLSSDSKGVVQGFVLAQQHIEAANKAREAELGQASNAHLADMLGQSAEQQKAATKKPPGIIRTADGPMEATPHSEIPIEQRNAARAKYADVITRLEGGEHVVMPRGSASVDMLASISAATGREVALLRQPGGERFLVLGTESTVDLPPGTKIIAHTHPGGNLQFSGEDHAALNGAGQKSSVLIGADGTVGRFRTSEKEIPANLRNTDEKTLHEPEKIVELKDPERFAKFIPNADPLHKQISEQDRFNVIKDFPVKLITSAPGHQNLRSPQAMVGMAESMTKAGTGSIFEGKEPIQLNVFTETINGKVVVKSIEVQDGNHRLAAGLYAGKWNSIKDIPPSYLNIEVNGFDTQGTQHPRWIPLAVAQESGIPKDQWFEVPANWGAKGPTAQVSGGVSSQDSTIPEKFRGVTLDKVIARSLERVEATGTPPATGGGAAPATGQHGGGAGYGSGPAAGATAQTAAQTATGTGAGTGGRETSTTSGAGMFEVSSFTAVRNTGMLIGDSDDHAGMFGVQSGGIRATAHVRPLTPEAQRYSVGYVQTLHSSHRTAIYQNPGQPADNSWVATRGQMLDQYTDTRPAVPWYNPPLHPAGAAAQAPAMTDNPTFLMPPLSPSPSFSGLAELRGSESFTTYLVAMVGNDPSTIIYLGNVPWNINWAGRFNASLSSFSGQNSHIGGASIGSTGGALLSGPVANAGPEARFTGTAPAAARPAHAPAAGHHGGGTYGGKPAAAPAHGGGGGGGDDAAFFGSQMTSAAKAGEMLRQTPAANRAEMEQIVRSKFGKEEADKIIHDNPSTGATPAVHAKTPAKPAPAGKQGGKAGAPTKPHAALPTGGKHAAVVQQVAAKHEEGVNDIGAFKGASTSDLSLIHQELVEHEQWKTTQAQVGEAGSSTRAAFVAEQTGKGIYGAAGEGFAMGVGGVLATKGVEKGVAFGLTKLGVAVGGEEIPGIGPIIAGAMSAYSLYTKNWKETGEKIAQFGKGSDTYEVLANSLQSIAEVIDIVVNVVNVIAGVVAAIGLVMWIVTVCTLGAAAPLAVLLTEIAAACVTATLILDAIAKLVINPMILLFRAMHTFKSEADPRDVKEQGDSLSETANQTAGFVGNLAGGKAAEAGVEAVGGGKTPEAHDGGTPESHGGPGEHSVEVPHEGGDAHAAPKAEPHDAPKVEAKPPTEHEAPKPTDADPHAKGEPEQHEPANDNEPAKQETDGERKQREQQEKQKRTDEAKQKVDEAEQAKHDVEAETEKELEDNRHAREKAKQDLEEAKKARHEATKQKLEEIETKRAQKIEEAERARREKLDKIAEQAKTNDEALKAAKETADAHKEAAASAREAQVESADRTLETKTEHADQKLSAAEERNLESTSKAVQKEFATREQAIERGHAEANKHLAEIEDPELKAQAQANEDASYRAKKDALQREKTGRANELNDQANAQAKTARDQEVAQAKAQHDQDVAEAKAREAEQKQQADDAVAKARAEHDSRKQELKGDRNGANDEARRTRDEANNEATGERDEAKRDRAEGDKQDEEAFDKTAEELRKKNIEARKKGRPEAKAAEKEVDEAKEELDKEQHSAPYRFIRDWVIRPFFTDPFSIKKNFEKAHKDIDLLGPKDTTKALLQKDQKEKDKTEAERLSEALKPKDGPDGEGEGAKKPDPAEAKALEEKRAKLHGTLDTIGTVGGAALGGVGGGLAAHAVMNSKGSNDFVEGLTAKENPEKIERAISPKYQDPPFPEAKLSALQAQIEKDLGDRAAFAAKRAKELELQGKEKHNAAQLAEAQKMAKEATEAQHAHKGAVDRKQAAIQAQQKRLEDANKQGQDGAHRTAGLVVLEVPLTAFRGFTWLAAKLPGRVGAKFDSMHHDAEDFQAKLSQMKLMVSGNQQKTAGEGKTITADQQTNTATGGKSVATGGKLSANEGKLGSAKQRVDGAVTARGAAAAQAAAQEQKATASAQGGKSEYEQVQGAMVAWAHQHQQARIEAKAASRARDEGGKGGGGEGAKEPPREPTKATVQEPPKQEPKQEPKATPTATPTRQ